MFVSLSMGCDDHPLYHCSATFHVCWEHGKGNKHKNQHESYESLDVEERKYSVYNTDS